MTRSRAAVPALYYGVVTVLLALAVTDTLGSVLPGPLAAPVGKDSEGLLLALLLPAWVQYARPRLAASPLQWPATGAVSAVLSALGVLLIGGDLPGSVETLNEPVFALAVLLPYVQLPRPLPRGLVLVLPLGVLLLPGLFGSTELVTLLAECLAMLVLVPIGLDLVDRAVLDPQAPAGQGRWAWYAFLLVAPTAIALAATPGATGALRYGERLQEAFLGVLVLEVYLALVLGQRRSGRHQAPARSRAPEVVGGG